jgi:hypothetical protein
MYLKSIYGHILSLMTIFNGSKGSICFYYKGLLINSFPLTNKCTAERYLYQGTDLIMKSKGINIKKQIKMYLYFCNMIYTRKKNNLPIYKSDHIYFLNCITALLRLKIIDNDELNGYMCFGRKKC